MLRNVTNLALQRRSLFSQVDHRILKILLTHPKVSWGRMDAVRQVKPLERSIDQTLAVGYSDAQSLEYDASGFAQAEQASTANIWLESYPARMTSQWFTPLWRN
jgi:hypothetical protein